MKIIKEHKNKIIIGLLIIILAIIYSKPKEQIEQESIEFKTELEEKEPEKPKIIKIDIKGEVKEPGVYELKENDRVSDAIKISGGLTENADTTLINLSKNLKDEMVIIIYNKQEIEKIKETENTPKTIVEYIEKDCYCPDTINDACINEAKKNKIEEATKDNKISINNASKEELETLPGIGESKAEAIIKYRKENGPFKEIEEITNISGIGKSTLEKFKDYITL